MGKEGKHIIPRDQYRRRRRVFKEDGARLVGRGSENQADGREFGPDEEKASKDARQGAEFERRREFESSRTDQPREFSNGPDARHSNDRVTGGTAGTGHLKESREGEPIPHIDAQNEQKEAVSGDNHSGSQSRRDEDAGENPSTQEQKAAADEPQDYGPGEEGFADKSAPAGAVGVTSASHETSASGDSGSGGSGSGNNGGSGSGGRGGRGWLRSLLIPLIAGVVGALIVLLLYSTFSDSDSTETADQPSTQDEQPAQVEEGDGESMTEENRQEIDDIKEQMQQESGSSGEGITDTTAAIQRARQSVVSVINMQEASSLMPGAEQSPESGEESAPESDPEQAGTGSGVIYKLTDDSAYIVTNNHVVDGAEEVQVNLANGDQLQAELIGSDLWTDLAVLRVDRGNIDNAIDFGDSDNLYVGETAIAIGSPLGETFSGSVSRGIVSGLDRSVPVDIDGDGTYDWESNVIQTDAAINPGNSGGALVDGAGNLIGINSMKINMPTVEGIGFAIPANEVQQIVTQLEENGEVQRPFLGIMLQDLYTVPAEILVDQMNLPEDVTEGVIVSNIEGGSPAEDGGLEKLDVIISLDGQKIPNMMELRQYLYYEKEQGDDMTIEYYRDGELQETTVTLD